VAATERRGSSRVLGVLARPEYRRFGACGATVCEAPTRVADSGVATAELTKTCIDQVSRDYSGAYWPVIRERGHPATFAVKI
jgi:hypothetical protein